jgi:PAS domain S-box-containing protein
MEFKVNVHDKMRLTAKVLAWIITLLGLFFVIGWNFAGDYTFVKVPMKGLVLSYFSSISILISGLIFLNLIYFPRFIAYKLLAFVTFFLSSMRLIEILFNYDFGISGFVASYLFTNIKNFPSVLLGGALNTFLNALVFLIWPLKYRTSQKSAFINICLALTLLFSVEGVFVYLLPLDPQDFIIKAPIHPLFALTQIFLALGLLAWNFYQDSLAKIKIIKWFSIFFGGGILLFHFFLMTGLLQEQRLSQEQIIKKQSLIIKSQIQTDFLNVGTDLHQFASRLEIYQSIEPSFIESDILSYLKNISYVVSISVVNDQFKLVKSVSKDGTTDILKIQKELGSDLVKIPQVNLTHSFFNSENKRAILASSVIFGAKFQGAIFFELDLIDFFKNQKALIDNSGFTSQVYCDGSLIYESASNLEHSSNPLQVEETFQVNGLNLKLIISGSSNLMINNMVRFLIIFLALGGVSGGFITGLIIYLIQVLRSKVRTSQKIVDQLSMSNEIMQVMNEADTVQNACDLILKIMNRHYNWQLFLYWQFNKVSKSLELVHVTSIPEGAFGGFESLIKEGVKTLAKEAFDKKEILFAEDISLNGSLFSKEAFKQGLKGQFALPVYQKRDVLGVIELFKKEVFDVEPETGWIDLMKIIGNQFTVFIERREAHLIDKELAAIITNSTDAIYKVDLDLKIRSWNLGGMNIYGYLPEEIIGKGVSTLYPQEKMKEIRQIQDQLLQGKTIEHLKTIRSCKDGRSIWVENSYAPIFNEKNQVVAFCVVSRDIDLEKRTQEALKLNEEKFRQFVDATQSWIWEMDREGNFTYSNPAILSLLGYSQKEILQLNWKNLALEKQKLEKELKESLGNFTGWKQKLFQVLSKNSSVIWLESSAEPIKNERQEFMGLRGVCRDVTEQIKIDRSKSEFISMVSHELRTPLTSILGATSLLKSNNASKEEAKELLDLADRNAERLLKLVSDILDIEKLSLGKMQLNIKAYELAQVLQEALKVALVQAEKEHVHIRLDHILTGVLVLIDYDRLVQVILNLLSNAIKFSPKESAIIVSMMNLGEKIRLSVKDNGPGIPYDLQGKIFEKFVQAESGDTKNKGTGLGLNISKALIEQMGGSIGFNSEPSVGSIFYIDIPIFKKE